MMHRHGIGRKAGWALLLLSGCPARFDPRAEPVAVQSSDPAASKAYHDARNSLDAGDYRVAQSRFRDFRAVFPQDPLATSATLWEARADLEAGDGDAAKKLLEPLAAPEKPADDPVVQRARFLLGLALARVEARPEAQRARELLLPFGPLLGRGDDAVELHAALAHAEETLGEIGPSLVDYATFYDGARPGERSYVRERAARIAGKLGDAEALALLAASPRDGLAVALLGARAAEERRRSGDPGAARTLDDETRAARRRFGLEVEADHQRLDAAGALTVGLVLPLSGRGRLLGERALRGALLAADALPASGQTLELRIRDSESSPDKAGALVDELAAQGVAAIISSPDRAEAQVQAAHAERLGVPLLELAPDDNARTGGLVLKLIRQNPARAEALAARAVSLGSRRVATLYPDSSYGKKMAESFAAAARAKGAQVVGEIKFDEKGTTFIAQAKQLAQLKPDAVFVPAPAQQLELVAAQLAATGVLRTQGGKRGSALLCATADGLTPKLLLSVGRYVQGALLAPVFYPDAADQSLAPFVGRFRDAYGEEPGTADAVAFDAVRSVREALRHADVAGGRAALAQALQAGDEPGVTGRLRFTATGDRGGEAQLYIVDGDAIRALR